MFDFGGRRDCHHALACDNSVSNRQITNFSLAPHFPAVWYVGPTVDRDANDFDY